MNEPITLVTTLGGQPQIVTFSLDLLMERGERIDQVVIVYLASEPRYYNAYRQLMGEFTSDQYAGRPCHLRSVPIRANSAKASGEITLADARTPNEVEAVRSTFYHLLAELKSQGHRVHLSLSAGRRIMALTALSAAMQHLTPADRIWHIYTPPGFTEKARDGKIMHAPPGAGLLLIEVPFVPWAAYFPGLRPLLETPGTKGQHPLPAWQDKTERSRCQKVWASLTSRQQEVLQVFAQGYSRRRAAEYLGIDATTVDSHRKVILEKCSLAWQDDGQAALDTEFLREHFGPFLPRLD